MYENEIECLLNDFMKTEDHAMAGLERFITLCPVDLLSTKIFEIANRTTETPLYSAAKFNYLKVAARLIELGVAVDEGVIYNNTANILHGASPLTIACTHGHTDMCRLLLAHNANVLHLTANRVSLLMLAKNAETARLLIAKSDKRNILHQLLSIKSKDGIDAGPFLCISLNSEAILELMNIPGFANYLNIEHLLSAARLTSISSPEQSEQFDQICEKLQAHKTRKTPLQLDCAPSQSQLTGSYFNLFSQTSDPSENRSFEITKVETIKSVITQYYHLLHSPEQCMHYLQSLNDDLQRYYQNKYNEPFPVLDKDTYNFQLIGDLLYPIPEKEYTGIKKHRALSELLITIFKDHGLAEQAFKWIGFIPSEKSNEQVRRGYFFTEGKYGTGLLHGKLAHMIQRVLLIYAIENGTINLSFQHNNTSHSLTIIDILDGLVSLDSESQDKAWLPVQDRRCYNSIQFTDPHRLTTTIMHEGHTRGLSALADSLTDSFCKGLRAYFKTYKTYTPFSEIDLTRFIRHLNDMTLHIFSANPDFIKAEIDELVQERKLQHSEIDSTDAYALVPKIYEPAPSFRHAIPSPLAQDSGGIAMSSQ